METRLQQANAWGKVFGTLSFEKFLSPAILDTAIQNPKAALAMAMRGKHPSQEAELMEAINLIDAGVDLKPMNNDEEGQFWIGFYHQLGKLDGVIKKPGAPLAEDRVDWSAVDWSQPNAAIARQTGKAPQTVAAQRKRHAPK